MLNYWCIYTSSVFATKYLFAALFSRVVSQLSSLLTILKSSHLWGGVRWPANVNCQAYDTTDREGCNSVNVSIDYDLYCWVSVAEWSARYCCFFIFQRMTSPDAGTLRMKYYVCTFCFSISHVSFYKMVNLNGEYKLCFFYLLFICFSVILWWKTSIGHSDPWNCISGKWWRWQLNVTFTVPPVLIHFFFRLCITWDPELFFICSSFSPACMSFISVIAVFIIYLIYAGM